MKLLLFGELGPGALARSFEPGLATEATVLATDPYRSQSGSPAPPPTATARLCRRFNYRARVARAGPALVETVQQLGPDAVLVVKGRGIDAGSIARVRGLGVPVALYYPDNPAWAFTEVGAGGTARVGFETVIPRAVRDGRLQLRLVPQARMEPVRLDVELDAPAWHVTGPARWAGPWDRVRTVTWGLR